MSVLIFKPDEIGDFVLSLGAIRLLVEEHGMENTTLVVKSEIAPLARREFPKADIVELPWQPRIKGRNQAVANIRHCFPAWRRLRRLRMDQSVSLRGRRDYIQTALFAAPRAAQCYAPENLLLRNGRLRRRVTEALFVRWARPQIVPFPTDAGELPRELASHRAVVAAALGREVAAEEILPSFVSAPWRGGGGWLLCPFSSQPLKDYSAERWAEALRGVTAVSPKVLRLAGSAGQAELLRDFAVVLRSAGVVAEVVPSGTLEGFPDLIAAADLVLTVDTAAAHIACACGTPAVIAASGLHAGVYGPYSPNGRQEWLVGDYARLRAEGWQESVPPDAVAEAIRGAIS